MVKNLPAMRETGVASPGREDPLEKGMTTHASMLTDWMPLLAQMVKNLPAMRETQVRSLHWEDPLAKGMATHSSTLP